jgi:capsid protein
MLRGDLAAAMRLPQRYLDRDVRGANYSSMRADMLDSDRILAPVREWFGHMTAGRLYKAALPYLSVKAGVPMPKSQGYRLLPDGQPYVDPQKDAEAALTAIAGGLSTFRIEIAKRGGDLDEIWTEKAEEEKLAKSLGLSLVIPGKATDNPDTDTAQAPASAAKEPTNG